MAYNTEMVLGVVKVRLNRLPSDKTLDDYLRRRIEGAAEELEGIGIHLREESAADFMLLVDLTVWQYQNRDSGESMPKWLRAGRRERWLRKK